MNCPIDEHGQPCECLNDAIAYAVHKCKAGCLWLEDREAKTLRDITNDDEAIAEYLEPRD